MKLTLAIEMDNAAFGDNGDSLDRDRGEWTDEAARILRVAADHVDNRGNHTVTLRDINGNVVGKLRVTE